MRRFLAAAGAMFCFAARLHSQDGEAGLARQAKADTLRGDYKAAARDYYRILGTNDSPELRSNLGMMLYLSGDGEAALTQLRVALSRNPELTAANLFAGLSLIRVGWPREALPLLLRAEQLQPKTLTTTLALGRAYVAVHDIPNARQTYQRATEIDGSSAEAWYGLGVTSREAADEILHGLTANGQGAAEALSPAKTAAAREELAEAERALGRALELEPDGARAHMVLGEAFRDAGQLEESVQQYQAILKAKADYAPAYLGLANTYWKFGRVSETMAALNKLLDLSPGDAEGNAIMASLLVSEKQMRQAEPFAERALAERPDLSIAHMALAKIYLARNEPLKALPELQRAAADDVDGSYHYLLAETLRKIGRDKEAGMAFAESRRLRAAANPQ